MDEEFIVKVLDTYFSDFKEYHFPIIIGLTAIAIVLPVLQSIYIKRMIERFKNHLKKSEIKFSKYNELQITALRRIYHLLAEFHLANQLIFDVEPNSIDHTKLKNSEVAQTGLLDCSKVFDMIMINHEI